MAAQVFLGALIDDACAQFARATSQGRKLSELLLHPTAYRMLKAERARDFALGNPLMLLGLDVVEAPSLRPDEVELI